MAASRVIVEVVGIKKDDKSCKVEMQSKSIGTIYTNQCFIWMPWEDAHGISIGDQYELVKVDA